MGIFYGRTVADHLYLITHLDRLVTHDIYEADAHTIRYYTALAGCLTSTIPGNRLEDIFDIEEVAVYCDENGGRLPGRCLTSTCDAGLCTRCHGEAQLDYIRTELLPKFAAALLQHFSSLIFTYRNKLGGECGDPPKEDKPLPPCPSGQRMIDHGEVSDVLAGETAQERFLRVAEEFNRAYPATAREQREVASS